MERSYVKTAGFDRHDDINDARREARLSIKQCIELCDIGERTWYRWMEVGAPKWAIRLIESQIATLDRFGWNSWEIRNGVLYCNELHHRYYWEPVNLLLPLFNVTDSAAPFAGSVDNLLSIEQARRLRDEEEPPQEDRHDQPLPLRKQHP